MIPTSARLRMPALLLCAVAPVPGIAATRAGVQDGDLAERLLRSGERAYAAKSYKEALDTWNQLIQSAPKSDQAAQALLLLARHQVAIERKPEAALPFLDRLKGEFIKSSAAPEALVLRGEILARLARKPGDLKDAIAEFNRVLDLFPDHPACADALAGLGRAARDQGQWGLALSRFTEAYRTAPEGPGACRSLLEAAEVLDVQGDLNGCLRLLQRIRTTAPQSPEAQEAAWRILVRVRHRIQKPPLKLEGPWPAGKVKWLKTPTLLASNPSGEVAVFQYDLDRAAVIRNGEAHLLGSLPIPGTRAMVLGGEDALVLVSSKTGVHREGSVTPMPALGAPTGAFLDRWGTLWIADAKTAGLMLLGADGVTRSLPTPGAVALAAHPAGGAVLASDGNRALLVVNPEGQTLLSIPYGKDLPSAYKSVLALATDGAGHIAALVEGGDFGEGVVVYGPDGTLLRQATFKALGVSGRITSLALDRQGGIILCDRRNDTLLRLN
ncbi:MAG TPA: tetratricopeptide repeat protein [Holophagaceae bacterium]|nr:tetratricopeptide repeat protein [Holophagaceae bacterium]